MLTESFTEELPKEIYLVVHRDPQYGKIVPLFVPLDPLGFGLPVFSERELVEEFLASPNVDVPCAIVARPLELFMEAGELPIDVAKEHDTENEYFYMIDPRPTHEWEDVENMGCVVPMREAARALREELAE